MILTHFWVADMSFTSVLPTCFPRPFSHSYCIPILGPGSVQGAISITKGSANPTKHSYVLIQWKVCPSPFRTSSTLHAFCDPDTSRSRLCIPFNSDLPSLQGSILWVIGSKYFTEDNATSSMSQAGLNGASRLSLTRGRSSYIEPSPPHARNHQHISPF